MIIKILTTIAEKADRDVLSGLAVHHADSWPGLFYRRGNFKFGNIAGGELGKQYKNVSTDG